MVEAVLLTAAFLCAFAGMSSFALAMKPHWAQLQSTAPHDERLMRRLRRVGTACSLLSLAICLVADHVSMAFLVWIMTLSAAALLVAMTLAYAPRSLSWLARIAGSREAQNEI